MTSKSSGSIPRGQLPVGAGPSGLPLQDLISARTGATSLYVGQQWLQPGEMVPRHDHPVEEALIFLRGSGEATLGDQTLSITAGGSLLVPPLIPHGFRCTGDEPLHLLIIFPVPHFARTTPVIDPDSESDQRS